MYELRQLGARTYYIDCPVKMGLYRIDETGVCLIDSGNDKDAGKKVLKILEAQGWTLSMVINTHFHADHIGGNQLLQQRTGCRIYAPAGELNFVRQPVLEPSMLYGAHPPKALRHKALMARESDALPLAPEVLPEGLTLLELPGHSPGQIGLRTDDDVVFLADCLVRDAILEKYRISFLFDVEQYLETLTRVEAMTAAWFLPAHGEPVQEIGPLAEANRRNTLEVMEDLVGLCATPKTFEDLMAEVFGLYALPFDTVQYHLNGCTVKAMLAWLCDAGRLCMEEREARLFFRQA